MKCSDCVVLIGSKLDGTLSPDLERDLDAHLSSCSRCRAELVLQAKIGRCLAEMPPSSLAPGFAQRVSRLAVATERYEGRTRLLRRLVPAVAYAAGVALLIIFRTDIARVLPEASTSLAGVIDVSMVRLGSVLSGVMPAPARIHAEQIPFMATLANVLGSNLVAAGMACAAVLWASRRAIAFLRD
jgi:anti-sigma factor RsiW